MIVCKVTLRGQSLDMFQVYAPQTWCAGEDKEASDWEENDYGGL